METKQNDTGKMSRTQKVIVVVTAVTLAVILILMFTTRFMGSGNTYPIGDSQENSSTQTTAPSESPEETEPDALSETDQPESGLAFGSVPNTPTVPELPGDLSSGTPVRDREYDTNSAGRIRKRNLLLSHSSRKLHRRSLRNRKGEIRKRRRKNRKNRSRPRNSQGIGLMGRRYP